MAVERSSASGSLIDVLDRILDKGIVIDAYVRISLMGVDLVSVDARIVVASVQTYLMYADAISTTPTASRPQISARIHETDRLEAENAEPSRRLQVDSERMAPGIM